MFTLHLDQQTPGGQIPSLYYFSLLFSGGHPWSCASSRGGSGLRNWSAAPLRADGSIPGREPTEDQREGSEFLFRFGRGCGAARTTQSLTGTV